MSTNTSGWITDVHKGQSRKPADHALRLIAEIIREAPEPVLFSRIKLTRQPDPAAPHPVVAQASLDLAGREVREHARAATPEEAVSLLADRLWQRLIPEGP